MERISLTYFVDFVLKAGTPKLAGVREFKEHRSEHLTDFYKPLRETIVDMHEAKKSDKVLDALVDEVKDERKRKIYPSLIEGYRKFLASSSMTWFTPPVGVLPIGDLEVNINPELGFKINGAPHLIKMYFRGEALAQKRISLVLTMINAALKPAVPGATFAMLDVKNAKLHTLKLPPNPKLNVLLRGEAASFSTIYASV
jgi:hypothetical protein